MTCEVTNVKVLRLAVGSLTSGRNTDRRVSGRGFVKRMKIQVGSEKSEVPNRRNHYFYHNYAAARSGVSETRITVPPT
jgi:hypothetical protein